MDYSITCVWLETQPERSAWGVWIIDIDGSIQEKYGVSCRADRAILWMLLHIISSSEGQAKLTLRSQQQKTLNALNTQLKNIDSDILDEAHHDLISLIKPLQQPSVVTLTPVFSTPLEGDIAIKLRTKEAIGNFQLSFPPEDIDYIMANISSEIAEPVTSPPESTSPTILEPNPPIPVIKETTLTPPAVQQSTESPRLVGYIEGIGNQHLSAWSFVLIDRTSGHGLLRSAGVPLASRSRMPLIALTELLSSLKQSDMTIEIRCRHPLIFRSLSQGIPSTIDASWLASAGLQDADTPYLMPLSTQLNQHQIVWLQLDEQKSDIAAKWALEFAVESLGGLNTGDEHQFEQRMTNISLDDLQ